MNVVRAVSSEGYGRIAYYKSLRRRLDEDPQIRAYFSRQTDELPDFYRDQVEQDLGPLYRWLPEGSLYHDPNAYLKSEATPLAS
jgi:hypothetical protein